MKQLIKTTLRMMLLLVIPVYFYSCSDDEGAKKILLPKTEGFFVYGTNTIAEAPTSAAARMSLARMDISKGPVLIDSVYGKYMYIGANSTISFALVNENGGAFYGSSDAEVVNGKTATLSVDDNVILGTLEEGGAAVSVKDEGLYYVVADLNDLKLVITPVTPQLVGDALVDGTWESSIDIALKSISKTEVVYEAVVDMKFGGGYLWRFNEGYASYYKAGFATQSFLAEEDYGAAWAIQRANPGFFNQNIPSFAAGDHTFTLTYKVSSPGGDGVWTAIAATDYSDFSLAIIGNAIEGTTWNGNGTGGHGMHKPVKAGNVFTWTWNDVVLIEEGEFIFLQDATWEHMLIAYPGATVTGTAITADPAKVVDATTVEKPDHNFYVAVGGTYDITLVIDAASNTKTVTINNN